jgi:single-strand DNA-binding protein
MNYVIVVGNLGRDPELAFSSSGKAVCKMSVGSKERGRDGQEDVTTWHNVVAFNELAENTAASLSKGDRVIVIGRVRKNKFEKKDGTTGYSEEVRADEVGANLRFTVVTPLRAGASGGQRRATTVDDTEEPF